jgi:acyl carrier protein
MESTSHSDTLARVRNIISEQLGRDVAEVSAESRIVTDLGADSLDVAELLLVLEETFKVDIPEAVALDLVTVGDVAALADRLTQSRAVGVVAAESA